MPSAAMWMDLETIILGKVSQTDNDKLQDIDYVWNLKKNTNELMYKTGIDSQSYKMNHDC